jgi:transcriptional regulator with XRE-family HTH domain
MMDNVRVLVGDRIRNLRKERGWSQEKLGEKADLHHTYVGAVERGEKNASIDTLDKIADAMGIEMADLFTIKKGKLDVDRLRAYIIEEVRESSPGMLKLIAALIQTARSEKALASGRTKEAGKKET